MRKLSNIICMVLFFLAAEDCFCQKINGEIFIPLNNRSEIWVRPAIDTLDNLQEYEFKIRVSPEYKISQFLFEKGLATQNDSVLVIKPNSTKYGSLDTATLRVIVISTSGSRIMLFQKQFFIRVPDKLYPVITNPKVNLVKLNDKILLERNRPYPKHLITDNKPFVTMYDNEVNMKKLEVKSVTVALFEKEGKNYTVQGDTLPSEALREIRKIKDPVPVFIKVDGTNGKSKKSVWNRIVVYTE